jgi:hypothetical protein
MRCSSFHSDIPQNSSNTTITIGTGRLARAGGILAWLGATSVRAGPPNRNAAGKSTTAADAHVTMPGNHRVRKYSRVRHTASPAAMASAR